MTTAIPIISARIHNGNKPGIITSITFTRNKTAEVIATARSAPGLPAPAALTRSGRTTANTATITPWTHASRVVPGREFRERGAFWGR